MKATRRQITAAGEIQRLRPSENGQRFKRFWKPDVVALAQTTSSLRSRRIGSLVVARRLTGSSAPASSVWSNGAARNSRR